MRNESKNKKGSNNVNKCYYSTFIILFKNSNAFFDIILAYLLGPERSRTMPA